MYYNIIYASLPSQRFKLLNFQQVLHTRLGTLSQNLHLDSYYTVFTHYKDNTITIYRPKGVSNFSLAWNFIQQLPKVRIHFLTFYNNNEPEFKVKGKLITLQAKEMDDCVMTLDFQQLLTCISHRTWIPEPLGNWEWRNLGERRVNCEYKRMNVEWLMGEWW